MSVTMPRLMLLACLLTPSFLWPSAVWALGLGEIHLNSALNEPLNADIDLLAAAPDELTALRASLAGRDSFTRYGIDRPAFLSTLTFKVGKGKDGRDALLVRSTDAIPEPFVTFLVEVNWSRGRLMREYTVLLDPPVYSPGETASSAAPVAAATSALPASAATARRPAAAPSAGAPSESRRSRGSSTSSGTGLGMASESATGINGGTAGTTYQVGKGDTLSKIAHSLRADSPVPATPANIDQTMIAVYRANPDAFGGNINILRQGSVLRVPGADAIAALNENEAMKEVRRQMSAWHGGTEPAPGGHLRLVTPVAGAGSPSGTSTGTAPATSPAGAPNAANAETNALKDKVKDLEEQLANSRRLLEVRNGELSDLQRKLAAAAAAPSSKPAPAPAAVAPQAAAPPPVVVAPTPTPAPPPTAQQSTPPPPPAATPTPLPPPTVNSSAPTPAPAVPAPAPKPRTAAPAESAGSWIDWVEANWWLPAAVIVALIAGLAFAATRRGRGDLSEFGRLDSTDIADFRDPKERRPPATGRDESFVVEESGEHRQPEFVSPPEEAYSVPATEGLSPDDTMSSESAVNLDQGDPLAEADFHMAYGLYDQAADLVRIALEREPDRRDLRLKLLEIYFVWGNKDAFLQTAKGLEATRDRAPAGEWDKIVIMGKQICPGEPLFSGSTGGGRGAGALVDLNLEGGENRVDIDLFGDPEGERSSLDHPLAKDGEDTADTGEMPSVHGKSAGLDFTLDAPERGADDSPTREMPPRDEPTVESELLNFADLPTAESPALKPSDVHDRISSKLGAAKADQTAEVSIDDLGLDLEQIEDTGSMAATHSSLESTDDRDEMPTMVAGLDEKSRRMMAEADKQTREKDMTELERELEASFIADLDSGQDEVNTEVLGPESAPTVQMPRASELDVTSRFKSKELSDIQDAAALDGDSTSKLRPLSGDSIDLDLDRLASALGSGDTVEQPRSDDELFSTEVFEASQRNRRLDLDVGDALNGLEVPTNKLAAITSKTDRFAAITTAKSNSVSLEEAQVPELEPVTMSEVGTKLDLARAYMDMGDPEGARSILEEVVHEGSASQKQEAQRLIETLPG